MIVKTYKLLNVECKFPHLTDDLARENALKFNNNVSDASLKYSIVLCINKNDTAKIKKFNDNIDDYLKYYNIKNTDKSCLIDGDNKFKDTQEKDTNFLGYMVVTAKNKKDYISIVGKDRKPIDGSEITTGCIVNAIISFYQYRVKNVMGTYCALHKIQLLEKRSAPIPEPLDEPTFSEEDSHITPKVDSDDPF